MARVTIDDCLERVGNRFSLIHLAAERSRQLRKGARPLIPTDNHKEIVLALREIAAGEITYENIKLHEPAQIREDTEPHYASQSDSAGAYD
jgi:DNA-directed RNA polymerase subunit omega